MKCYVYRFLNSKGEIVYIGQTQHIKSRMDYHFTSNDIYGNCVIPRDKLDEVQKIEYIETTMANGRVLEAYLIAKNKPKFNTDFVEEDELTYELVTGNLEWKDFPITYRGENPKQNLRIRDKWGKILYDVPYLKAFYKPLEELLGLQTDLSTIRYSMAVIDGEYTITRVKLGNDRQNANEINTVAK